MVIDSFDELVSKLTNDINDGLKLIGIDGFQASGKTTLSKALKTALGENIAIIDVDDFIIKQEKLPTNQRKSYLDVIDKEKLKERISYCMDNDLRILINGVCLLDILIFLNIRAEKIIYLKRCVRYGDHIFWKDEPSLASDQNNLTYLDKELLDYHQRTKAHESADYIYRRIED